jgi:hypothetical protein
MDSVSRNVGFVASILHPIKKVETSLLWDASEPQRSSKIMNGIIFGKYVLKKAF